MTRGALSLVTGLLTLWPALALGQDGEPLMPGDFDIDVVTGPVLGSGRIVGLGGAYTALATGIDGAPWNPASYASRDLWSLDWFEWDGTLGLTPGSIRNSDFDNNGEAGFTYDDFLFLTLGIDLQFGALGVGGVFTVQSYRIGDTTDLTLQVGHYGVGYSLMQGQLVTGLGFRSVSLSVTDSGERLVDFGGVAPEAGAVLRLAGQPFRIGAAARLPVESEQAGTSSASMLNLPRTVRLPWQVQAGVAWQLGTRPLNRLWQNPHDAREHEQRALTHRRALRARRQAEAEAREYRARTADEPDAPRLAHPGASAPGAPAESPVRWLGTVPRDREFWRHERIRRREEDIALERELADDARRQAREVELLPRQRLLLSADAIFVGPTERGVGFESFLSQTRQRSGQDVSVGLRVGAETEPIHDWVVVRGGSYLEPSRFDGVGYRLHGTLGVDVRLFSWDLFGLVDEFTLELGSSLDVAERYLNVGVGLGMWH